MFNRVHLLINMSNSILQIQFYFLPNNMLPNFYIEELPMDGERELWHGLKTEINKVERDIDQATGDFWRRPITTREIIIFDNFLISFNNIVIFNDIF